MAVGIPNEIFFESSNKFVTFFKITKLILFIYSRGIKDIDFKRSCLFTYYNIPDTRRDLFEVTEFSAFAWDLSLSVIRSGDFKFSLTYICELLLSL